MRDRKSAAGPARSRRAVHLRRALLAALVPPLVVGGFMLQSSISQGGRLFQEVLARVTSYGVEAVPEDSLYQLAARGLLRRIGDPYADLYSPRELAEFQRENLRNGYGGLGMLVELVRDTAVVMRVYNETPAQRAGVRVGDRIVEVGGKKVTGLSLDRVTGELLGPQGTTVHVKLVRRGSDPVEVDARRAVVHVPVVPYALMLEDHIGYVPLDRFSETSAQELTTAVANLRKAGARSFVIDLRGNGGGSLEQSIRISNAFVKKGDEILRVVYRNAPTEVYRATGMPLLAAEPVVVLTDGGTASASEIVAGALQDHDRAAVVGTQSFGKGLVQDLFPLEGGWAMKLTTGKWFTPSGRSIQRERKVNPDGTFAPADTMPPSDSAVAHRPVFHSDSGRPVFGGGGITPDVIVREDTLSAAELALARTLASKSDRANQVFSEYSLELARQARPGFTVTPAIREEVFARLRRDGVPVERRQYDTGVTVIDRTIQARVSALAFGDSASFRLGAARDPQLRTAISLLRGSGSQAETLARAAAAAGAPSAATASASHPAGSR